MPALSILAKPLNVRILRAHQSGPQRLKELRRQIPEPAESTLRAAIAGLEELGALRKREVRRLPYGVATSLAPPGEELIAIAESLESWLSRAPCGPLPLDSEPGSSVVKALAAGRQTRIVHHLVAAERSLAELDRLIPEVSYPSLERGLRDLRRSGLVDPTPRRRGGTPYAATPWLREAMPLFPAIARLEWGSEAHAGARGEPAS